MLKYYCENCKVETETSICPVCQMRTIVKRAVYWCKECNVPIINPNLHDESHEIGYLSKDIRPVYPQERLLIELIWGEPLKYINSSVWCVSGGTYVIDGVKKRVTIGKLGLIDDEQFRKDYLFYSEQNNDEQFNNFIDLFVRINKEHYNYMVSEATNYISERTGQFDFGSTFVSFSGGKDSTVTSHLVIKALGTPKVVHIFGDTSLEFPETYDYVVRFKNENKLTPMVSAKNKEKNFYEVCETIGPPSRVMRWCCTIFKTGAITNYINMMFKNKTRILTFYGIRRSESTSRSKYDRDSDSPKIKKQKTVSPIIDWFDVDVWLYLLTTKIDFNDAYKLGFSRVGCWCCPNNSGWSEFLSKIHHKDDFYNFRDILVRNAVKIGKPDPEVYVDSGAWKAKQGGDGIDYGKKQTISFKPCATEDNAFNYQLQKPIDQNLYELFKPFGKLNYDLGNKRLGEVVVLDHNNNILLKLQGKPGETELKVTITNLPIARAKTIKDAEGKIKCQLTKFQMCLNCTACLSMCKFNAIKIKHSEGILDYKVDENKCVHCFECINHFTSGCYMKKVLATKDKE